MFQHRHFKFIAAVVAAMPHHAPTLTAQRMSCANSFADALAATNPKFDRARFLSACMGEPCNGRDKVAS